MASTDDRVVSRRSVTKAAWLSPVVLAAAAAPAFAASPLFNAKYQWYLGYNSVSLYLYRDTASTYNQNLPTGFQYRVTITLNSATPQNVNVQSSGVFATRVSSSSTDGSTPPWGGARTISSGVTWTYTLKTTALTTGATTGRGLWGFELTGMQPDSRWTISVTTITPDGNPANNTLTWGGSMPGGDIYFGPAPT